jgi:hypothetical protein
MKDDLKRPLTMLNLMTPTWNGANFASTIIVRKVAL